MDEPTNQYRAQPPQPSQPTRALQRVRVLQQVQRSECEQVERRGMVRGLLLLALVVLLASVARAGLDRVFLPGWWRHW